MADIFLNQMEEDIPARGEGVQDTLEVVQNFITSGNLREALRWADKAQRRAPASSQIAEIIGRLFLALGDPASALLNFDLAEREIPAGSLTAAIVSAQISLEAFDPAAEVLASHLNSRALDPSSELASVAARLMALPQRDYPGWIGITTDLRVWGELSPSRAATDLIVECGGIVLEPHFQTVSDERGDRLRFAFEGSIRSDQPIVAKAAGQPLIGSGLALASDFRLDGRCSASDGVLTGWVQLDWSPEAPPSLVLRSNAGEDLVIPVGRSPLRDCRHRFSVSLADLDTREGLVSVAARLPDGRIEYFPDSPAIITLPVAPTGASDEAGAPQRGRVRKGAPTTDVIIPVYQGREETLDCIESVLATAARDVEIIVIDDASPDLALKSALADLAAAGRISLLTNETNLGYPKSVNRGLMLHPDRDVVLLNADTEVFNGWLPRLKIAAYSAPDIGTVTPLTNSGAIATFPNDTPSAITSQAADKLNRHASYVNFNTYVEAPTGVGFCLYVRHDCRNAVGLLDEQLFSRGYGEENDFCMRASHLGWRHLIAANVFVRHHEGRSFGRSRLALMERNARLLALRHPDYEPAVEAFLKADPLHLARRALEEKRLTTERGPFVLLISLDASGGVRRYVNQRSDEFVKAGSIPIVMEADQESRRIQIKVQGGGYHDLTYDSVSEVHKLTSLTASIPFLSVEIHHFLGYPASFLEALLKRATGAAIYIHDYSWICPRITLISGGDRYCGEPDVSECEICIHANGSYMDPFISTEALRRRSGEWLNSAKRVVTPTRDVKIRLSNYFPDVSFTLQPWERDTVQSSTIPSPSRRLKVAVIGATGAQKGLGLLLDCARDAAARSLPIDFVIVGYSADDAALLDVGNVFITGEYEDAEIQSLLQREGAQVAFFASVTPETWSFSLSHALRARLPIVALDLGAIAERTRSAGVSCALLPLKAKAPEINAALLSYHLPVIDSDDVPLAQPKDQPVEITQRQAPAIVTADPTEKTSRTNAKIDRVAMSDAPIVLTSVVQLLTLRSGLYHFSVSSASPTLGLNQGSLVFPAVHVVLAPGAPADSIEFMTGLQTDGAWLFDQKDMLIAKVKSTSAHILITSYSAKGFTPLAIEIERMDRRVTQRAVAPKALPPQQPVSALPGPSRRAVLPGSGSLPSPSPVSDQKPRLLGDGRRVVGADIQLHVSQRGDLEFSNVEWAGVLGEKLAIEGVAIAPTSDLRADEIEYKALDEKGAETRWVTGGRLCGTRQKAVALVGFAVRVKGPKAHLFECRCRGSFRSGTIIGPVSNGAPLRSTVPNDPLVAIQVEFIEISQERSAQGPVAEAPVQRAQLPPSTPVADVVAPPEPDRPRSTGPRFSVFRTEAG